MMLEQSKQALDITMVKMYCNKMDLELAIMFTTLAEQVEYMRQQAD